MTYKENIRAILECHFAGFKEEIIDSVCNRILEQEPVLDVLDEIRAKVKAKIVKRPWLDFKDMEKSRNDAFLEVLDIIDKYRAEREGK